MKIAIIGAGFTGLAAAYRLGQQGNEVTVFEKGTLPGGLAVGYQHKGWDWTLEKYYHHWFTSDANVLQIAKEINFPVSIKRPKTSVYVDGKPYQLDSPLSLLTFPKLTIFERFRMAETLALLRYNPFWKHLEKVRAASYLENAMGERAYKMLWEPQLINKFGHYSDVISLAWFWARIKKRTPALAYPRGGFLTFAKSLQKAAEKYHAQFLYQSDVTSIVAKKGQVEVTAGKTSVFDTVLITLPSFPFMQLCPQLPEEYKHKLQKLEGLGAMTVVLRLKKQFLTDNTYWLSICDTTSPIMAIVEHTNFMNKKYYNGEHLVYLGNYLPTTHPFYTMTEKQLLNEFHPLLERIHPGYEKNLIGVDIFKTPFAQPIIPVNYSKLIPPFKTPLENVYLANIQQVYPWDRGTNYAIELGERAAQQISNS